MGTDTLQDIPKNRFRNNSRVVELGKTSFDKAGEAGLLDQYVTMKEGDILVTRDGHEFINFSCCSYLGLHNHPKILEGARQALLDEGYWRLSISTVRVCSDIHRRVEEGLSKLYDTDAILALSCSSISEGVLPILAAGILTGGKKPAMVFDKHSHFSMATLLPNCGDETDVYTCTHNDFDYIEDLCKKHDRVAYVADGVYSMGGHTRMKELKHLQDKYGMFLYVDDSHSLALVGDKGQGFVRDQIGDGFNENTIIVASLGKAFGTSGGVAMLGPGIDRQVTQRFGGPLGWSQNLDNAACGAALASIDIHNSPELAERQKMLADNLAYFDERVETAQKGHPFPIRMVTIGEETNAVNASGDLFKAGFYCSAVFFPIVARGKAGIRVMLRANVSKEDIGRLCDTLHRVKNQYGEAS